MAACGGKASSSGKARQQMSGEADAQPLADGAGAQPARPSPGLLAPGPLQRRAQAKRPPVERGCSPTSLAWICRWYRSRRREASRGAAARRVRGRGDPRDGVGLETRDRRRGSGDAQGCAHVTDQKMIPVACTHCATVESSILRNNETTEGTEQQTQVPCGLRPG